MAAISEKILWPIVGIFIFGVLAGFYIDDRRRLAQEGTSMNEHGGKTAENKQANNEHAGKAANKTPSTATAKQHISTNSKTSSSTHSSSNKQAAGATSMSINEYLAKSSSERDTELKANVTHHQGFSGGIDEYLSGVKPKDAKNIQAGINTQASGATSMSMDEYQTKASGSSSSQQHNLTGSAYHGGLEGYLAKYGNGQQTPIKQQTSAPFNTKEHMGFHGSYEDYAKKYN